MASVEPHAQGVPVARDLWLWERRVTLCLTCDDDGKEGSGCQPRLERLKLLPPKVLRAFRERARRCSEPVRRAISRTT